jgi:phosphoserine phosphatase
MESPMPTDERESAAPRDDDEDERDVDDTHRPDAAERDGDEADELRRVSSLLDEPPAPDVELVVFDFDGTLAEQRGSWGLLYRLFGVEDAGNDRTAAYWEDELTFDSWCAGNVADWRSRNVTRSHLERAAAAVKLTTGANDLLSYMGRWGVPFGVVSSGLRDLMTRLERYDPAFVVSNEVVYEDDVPVDVTVRVGPSEKDEVLERVCDRRGVDVEDVLYVGDSHSDTEAFEVAGTAVLFDPDDRLDESDVELADHVVETRDLRRVLPYVVDGDA